jgi:hypothetical protein
MFYLVERFSGRKEKKMEAPAMETAAARHAGTTET